MMYIPLNSPGPDPGPVPGPVPISKAPGPTPAAFLTASKAILSSLDNNDDNDDV
jgi:hypothetical protein